MLDALRREVDTIPEVTAAGIVKKRMYVGFIDQVVNPVLPALTFSVTQAPSIRQARIKKAYINIGIYTKQSADAFTLADAIFSHFAGADYSFVGDDITIYKAYSAMDIPTLLAPGHNTALNCWESSVELCVEYA